MRFHFTLKFYGATGRTVRSLVGDHPASTVAALADTLNRLDFIVIDVWRLDGERLIRVGPTAINRRSIIKFGEAKPPSFSKEKENAETFE